LIGIAAWSLEHLEPEFKVPIHFYVHTDAIGEMNPEIVIVLRPSRDNSSLSCTSEVGVSVTLRNELTQIKVD
jgi:hypothetical protein